MKNFSVMLFVFLLMSVLTIIACVKKEEPLPIEEVENPENPKPGITELLGLPGWEEDDNLLRAFPGAEGGGMFTTGGRGGAVYHVTTLEDNDSQGSLRYAIGRSGARTIVFDVDGVIALNKSLEIKNDNITIAGQTAPGDGICLKNYSLSIRANNVIVRYIRCRMGDEKNTEGDAFTGRWQKNIIIDHCSMSWSTDECASFYANENFTLQWCLLAENLRNSAHIKGTHGYGGIWGGVNASFHHNLLAHHDSRNPRFDGGDVYAPTSDKTSLDIKRRSVDFRNSVVYNFSNFTAYGGEAQRVNFTGNYFKWGPGSQNGAGISYKDGNENPNKVNKRQWYYYIQGVYNGVDYGCPAIYIGDNTNYFTPDNNKLNSDNWTGFVYDMNNKGTTDYQKLTLSVPIQPDGVSAKVTNHTAATAFECVLDFAGASLKRDLVDNRAVDDTRQGKATCMNGSNGSINGYIDSQKDVGGWPLYTQGEVKVDTDKDGIPDYWEDEFNLNKNAIEDGNSKSLDPKKRYTNLELYLHWLVKEITSGQVAGGGYITQ